MEVMLKKMFVCNINADVILCAQWIDQLDSQHQSFHSYDSSLFQPTLQWPQKLANSLFKYCTNDFIKVELKNHIQT